MYRNRNWKPVPYTREEIEANAEYERIEALRNEEISSEILSWTAGNGSKISVHYGQFGGFDVIVDGAMTTNCKMVPAPAAYQAKGIVAKLGPVGLTAERKAICERA